MIVVFGYVFLEHVVPGGEFAKRRSELPRQVLERTDTVCEGSRKHRRKDYEQSCPASNVQEPVIVQKCVSARVAQQMGKVGSVTADGR